DDEPTKKSGKRRKQMARKGLHTSIDKDNSEGSDEDSEQDDSVTGEKGAYQIVREDGTDVVSINFGAMLKSISRDDLTELYRIVMNRYGMDGPEDELEKGFWNMFEEPLSTDPIWSEVGQQKIISLRDGLGLGLSQRNKAWCALKKHGGNPQMDLQDQGVIASGCSRYLTDYEEIDGGYVAFGGNPKRGEIIGKDTIKTGNLDFKNVYFLKELTFNLFSVSQMCDKKNSVLFNDTECIVLSSNFKLIDESQVLLRVPRKNNMYIVDLKNIVPKGGLTFLFAKATSDESKLWHRRLCHLNFKTMNKLVKGNLVRGLPHKLFENDQTCIACQKGKRHITSCKSKTENFIRLPLHLLHMDIFGPTFVKSLKKKMYCLVVIDDYSRFTWVFFLATKDDISGILKSFITGIENLVDHKVKVIRCDNETEFKSREMNQFCEMKEAVNTACYVQNRVLVVKSHKKTPYELFHDHLGKFDGKVLKVSLLVSVEYTNVVGYYRSARRRQNCQDYILLPLWTANHHIQRILKSSHDDGSKPSSDDGEKVDEDPRRESECNDQEKEDNINSTNNFNMLVQLLILMGINEENLKRYFIHALLINKWIEAMQEELLQFKLQEVWTLVDLPNGKRAIGSKWVFRNKKDNRGWKIEEEVYANPRVVYVDCIIFGSTKKEPTALQFGEVDACEISDVGLWFTDSKTNKFTIWNSKSSFCSRIVVACDRYNLLSVSHLHAVKRIFRYLKGQPKLGLWYPKDYPFDLVAYTDSDYAGASLDRKSTTGGKATKSVRLMMGMLFGMELKLILAKTINEEEQLHALVDGKKIIITKSSVRRDLQLADEEGVACLPNSTIFEQLALMGV
ncbi:putative ribonuclease H-like domain-containing protein, partial [Tanacetum coccineum]